MKKIAILMLLAITFQTSAVTVLATTEISEANPLDWSIWI